MPKSLYTRLKGVNSRPMRKCGLVATWLSGCGTMRGAGSFCGLAGVEEGEPCRRLYCKFSCRAARGGGTFCAAKASATGSAPSPSKNLAIAICPKINLYSLNYSNFGMLTVTFHCDRRSRGMAAAGSWSVTDVNCCKASCWSSESWPTSNSGVAILVMCPRTSSVVLYLHFRCLEEFKEQCVGC